MSIGEKMMNANSSNWLEEGLSGVELKKIELLGKIAGRLELARVNLGMNQKQFAKKLGVTQGMVSRWEAGSYNFTLGTLLEISEKLDLLLNIELKESSVKEQDDFKILNYMQYKNTPGRKEVNNIFSNIKNIDRKEAMGWLN